MSGTTASSLGNLWNATPVPAEAHTMIMAGTGLRPSAREILVGHDSIGRRHFMIPLLEGDIFHVRFRAAGLEAASPRALIHDNVPGAYFDVCCLDVELSGPFAQLCAELADEALAAGPAAVERCSHLLRSWAELFGSGPASVDRSRSIGLLGELWLLHKLSLISCDAIRLWTGPLGGVHDFRNGRQAIEVKTSLLRSGRAHTISSVDQLMAPSEGRLLFLSLHLNRVPGAPLSLRSILADLRALGVPEMALQRLLREGGFQEGSVPAMEEETYEIREAVFYEVGDDFPRITRSSFLSGALPSGVLSLRYDIDLSSNPPNPLSSPQVQEWLNTFVT